MRIFVHDYSGHAFPIQLSRWLASLGHHVWHTYSADIQSPRGSLEIAENDPETFNIVPLSVGHSLDKYNIVKRVYDERIYGNILAKNIKKARPDVVLCSNTPPAILAQALAAARNNDARFVAWVQDLYSKAFDSYVRKKFGPLGVLASWYVRRTEFGAIAASDAVVAISEDFVSLLEAGGVERSRIRVIENWAPLDEITPRPRNNAWAAEQGLLDKFVFLYSGTLGLKHNPSLLSGLAEAFLDRPETRIVVVSQGPGRQFLEDVKAAKGLDNLLLFDYVPFERLSDVLGSADVLVAILEPEAGVLSVPSKVLSYLCAGRPILGAMPTENLAAETIEKAGAGRISEPTDTQAFLANTEELYSNAKARETHEKKAIFYAQEKFDIDKIGEKFLEFIELLPGNRIVT